MKTSVRFLAMLLAILMVASAALTVTASSFKDVPDNYEYRDAVDVLTRLGVINGYEDGTFKPDAKVERDEMAKLVYVLATTFADAGSATANFTDTRGNWAEGYISWCVAESIIGGHGDGTFKPDDNVTYDQALKMVCALLGYTDFVSSKWPTDVRLVGIRQLNLNKGLPSTLNGSEELTRGQVAQIMYNALFVPMNKTKNIIITKDDTVDGSTYTIPVQVSMQLALDVWKFKTYTGQIVSTKNFGLDTTPTGKNDIVRLDDFRDDETGKPVTDTSLELDGEYELKDLGLADYEGKTDDLFARDIKLFFLEGEVVENTALVYGTFDYDVALATVKKSDGKADDLTKVSVAGTKYDIYGSKGVYYTMSTAGTATKADEEATSFYAIPNFDAAFNNFPKDSKDEYIAGQKISELLLSFYATSSLYARETSSAAIDRDGDGEYDYVFVIPQMAYKVTKIETVTNTETAKKETRYTFDEILSTWTRNDATAVTSLPKKDIQYFASDVTLDGTISKDDIIVASKFAGLFRIDYKVPGVETYITRSADGGTRFATDPGTNNYWNIPFNTAFYGATSATALPTSSIGADLSTGIYYIVKQRIIYSTVVTKVDPVNFGILIATEGQTEFVYDAALGKHVRKFPAFLIIDGKQITVPLSKINDNAVLNDEPTNVYGQYLLKYDNDGQPEYANKFIAYTIDKDGYYEIYTEDVLHPDHSIFNGIDAEKELVIAEDQTISYTKSSGFYRIGNTYFDLDENSTIYYVDTEGVLSVYTKNNIPKEFTDGTKTKTVAYFVDADEYVKTLVSVMITGELEPSTTSGANDANKHLLFLGDGDGKVVVDKEVHYIYRYFDIAAGETIETHSVLPATTSSTYKGSTGIAMYNGDIGAYKNDGQTLEKVNLVTNNFISKTRITGNFNATKSIFTVADPDGLSLSKAKFIELEINDSVVDATKKEIKSATLTSYDDLISAYEDAKNDDSDFYVIYGFKTDTNGKEVVYIIYGAKLDDQYEYFDEVFPTVES